jgi:hypothetical protein
VFSHPGQRASATPDKERFATRSTSPTRVKSSPTTYMGVGAWAVTELALTEGSDERLVGARAEQHEADQVELAAVR